MKVCEIFKSIEGEGIRTGQAAVFVRLHGCNLRCTYCDSMYAVEGSDYEQMDVDDIYAEVLGYRAESGVKCVTLTGGEPLIHEGAEELLAKLSGSGFEVNVETNGTVPCKKRLPGLFYTMDWKCKSSGMSNRMKLENIATLCEKDVLKFVVGAIEDLEEAEQVVAKLSSMPGRIPGGMPYIFISPVFGTISNELIVEWVLNSRTLTENNARFQVQLHKVIWDPNRRGV